MRRIIDVLLGVMLVAILGGAVMYVKQDRTATALREQARQERRRFQQQVALQSALERGALNERGFPTTIDPLWFSGDLPVNPLLGQSHPWVEVAPPSDRDRTHPPDMVAMDQSRALFWYNPQNGLIRARVPAGISDSATIDLYNYVNEVDVTSLFSGD